MKKRKKQYRQAESKPDTRRNVILVKFKSSGEIGLRINFPYNPKDTHRMSNLEGRRFLAEQKYWVAFLTKENISKLKEWGFVVDKRAKNISDE